MSRANSRHFGIWVALLLSPAVTLGQAAGRFYVEKNVFARDEPVFLYLQIVNHSPQAVDLNSGVVDQPFCSGVSIQVSSDAAPTLACSFNPDSFCFLNGQLGPPDHLASGATIVRRFLLNFRHAIASPGPDLQGKRLRA
ncbi:MAG TPA: hypothetical protein VKR52_00485 [Terracidiphilus sp.]|nr:hypothetical protein [Terracidiphilus sp.]